MTTPRITKLAPISRDIVRGCSGKSDEPEMIERHRGCHLTGHDGRGEDRRAQPRRKNHGRHDVGRTKETASPGPPARAGPRLADGNVGSRDGKRRGEPGGSHQERCERRGQRIGEGHAKLGIDPRLDWQERADQRRDQEER